MKEVSVTFWEVTPEEAIKLPKGTQLIEYCRFSGRLAVKRSDHCLYDYSCVYLLAKEPQAVQAGESAKKVK